MQGYKDDLTYAKEEAAEAVADRRYQRILEEMVKLGWDTESYAPEYGEDDHAKWEEYLFQPKEFTARSMSMSHSSYISAYILYCVQAGASSNRSSLRYTSTPDAAG